MEVPCIGVADVIGAASICWIKQGVPVDRDTYCFFVALDNAVAVFVTFASSCEASIGIKDSISAVVLESCNETAALGAGACQQRNTSLFSIITASAAITSLESKSFILIF